MSLTNASPEHAAKAASISSLRLARLSVQSRNSALTTVHDALQASKNDILSANAEDLEAATKAAESGNLSQSLVKRLDLGRKGKWEDMLKGILDVRDLDDPLGKITMRTELDDGLILERISCPIGVLLIIFEARPEVIANIASLAIKSGNAAILKGGKESTESFKAIATAISNALQKSEVPNDSIQLVTTRDVIDPLLKLDKYINLVIPRGSNELVRYIKDRTQIPVLGHADGLCSAYLRADANVEGAVKVIHDSKTNYPAACNSLESLLVDEDALTTVLPAVAGSLLKSGVSLRCDATSKAALSDTLEKHQTLLLQDAVDSDFDTEFLDLVLAVKTIPKTSNATESLELAIAHINARGSHHTDLIFTKDKVVAEQFIQGVDSSCVFWNTSTRMNDGMRFGFGTEVGISTNKIHSRGPVGLEGLSIYKYVLRGHMEAAGDYGAGGRVWKHKALPLR